MIEVTVTSSAADDLRTAVDYYAEESLGLAAEFLLEFDRVCSMLSGSPEIGSPTSRGNRRLVMQRFPYSVYYRVDDDRVLVLAVGHHRRHPDHWLGRL